jgi:hypothetical protein
MLIGTAVAWLQGRREHHRPHADPLSRSDLEWLSPFFEPQLLATVRLRRARPVLPWMAGITCRDTVLVDPGIAPGGPAWRRILFHELVHVVQFEVLGVDRFMELYLTGWARGGCRYRTIPLEVDAYAIESMLGDGTRPFPVRQEVERRLALRHPGPPRGGLRPDGAPPP